MSYPELTPAQQRRLAQWLETLEPAHERPLTVVEQQERTGRGDARPYIAKSRLSDPSYFPAYVFVEFPKALCRPATREDIEYYREKYTFVDTHTLRPSLMCALPALGAPVPVRATAEDVKAGFSSHIDAEIIFRDLDQETRWFKMHQAVAAQEAAAPTSITDLIVAREPAPAAANGHGSPDDLKRPKRKVRRQRGKAKAKARQEPGSSNDA
jgi:hypothetical protein